MNYGVVWYPEHWPEARWAYDLELMRQAGMNTVRLAEFAWSTLEPREGVFELDWLERAVSLAALHGMAVVLGTPSAAPPAWLTARYPEVLAVNENGQRATHGYRCHYAVGSEPYRRLAVRVAGELARRFGPDERVIGWQIDNEFKSVSFDADTQRQFQAWLEARYPSLEALNARWSSAYWSQTYSDWTQIPLPHPTPPFADGLHHPSLRLEWKRFVTHLYQRFQAEQLSAVRAHARAGQWTTHNFMGFFDRFDPLALSEDLDLVSWDNYVGSGQLDPHRNALMHDQMRGLKRKNFWLMETQVGTVNWAGVNNALRPGETRTLIWHAVGHGADAALYWQWRSAPGGQEQYHGCVLGADGEPRPVYGEVAQVGTELALCAAALEGSRIESQVALLYCAQDRWAIDFQCHHQDFNPLEHLGVYHRALREHGLDVDVVSPRVPLEGYGLVVAPHLHLLDPDTAGRLEAFMRGGGHLLLGARSGVKNPDNALLESKPPGSLAELLGGAVQDAYALLERVEVHGKLGGGAAQIWGEWLESHDPETEVLLRYRDPGGWLDGRAAMLSRPVGAGRITLMGFWPDPTLAAAGVTWALEHSRVVLPEKPPPGVELCRRRAGGREMLIAINHGKQA